MEFSNPLFKDKTMQYEFTVRMQAAMRLQCMWFAKHKDKMPQFGNNEEDNSAAQAIVAGLTFAVLTKETWNEMEVNALDSGYDGTRVCAGYREPLNKYVAQIDFAMQEAKRHFAKEQQLQ